MPFDGFLRESQVIFDPKVGDMIEFLSDAFCDRGPCSGEVLTVASTYCIVDVSGEEPYESLSLNKVIVESVSMPPLASANPRVRTWTVL